MGRISDQTKLENSMKRWPNSRLDAVVMEENSELKEDLLSALDILEQRKREHDNTNAYGKILREIIEMRYFDDSKFREIAEKYGFKTVKVRQLVSVGLNELRRIMDNQGESCHILGDYD